MTTQEIMEKVFRDSGEPTDMEIHDVPGDDGTFNIALPGSLRVLRTVNTAQTRLANWRFRDGRVLRMRGLRDRLYFQSKTPPTGATIAATASGITIPGLAVNADDSFNGWLIGITGGTGAGQTRLITDTVLNGADVDLVVDQAWDIQPIYSADPLLLSTYALYKSFFMLTDAVVPTYMTYHINVNPVTRLADITKIRDVSTGTDLVRSQFEDVFSSTLKSTGVPTQYMVYGNQLWLDAAPTELKSYEMLFIRQPAPLILAAQVPDLPEQYHDIIAQWAVHQVLQTNQDFNGAYAMRREVEDTMEMLRLQGSFDMDMEVGGVTVFG
jgi:hypothetical protein